jgi:hypothetical protein
LLNVIERISGVLNFSPALAPYMNVASVLMEGFETFFNAGGVEPLVGLRDSFGPNLNIPFQPGYFALIDAPDVDEKTLYVQKNQLMSGNSLESAKPFRAADYVLYSIIGPEQDRRDDIDTLPFNDLWHKVRIEAASPVDDPNYKNARLQMATLYEMMIASPDLTEPHAFDLTDDYVELMETIHKKAKKIGLKAGGEPKTEQERAAKERQDNTRRRALDIAKGL